MPQPQTVFRFITLRSPRKPRKRELETGFVKYSASLGAPLLEKVAALQGQGAAAVREAVAGFIRGPGYLRTPAELEGKFGALVEWGEWLMSTGRLLKSLELKARLETHPLKADPEAERVLWDNLVAYTLVGGVSEVREGLLNALRAVNLRRVRPELLDDEAALQRLGSATVLLPSNVALPRAPEQHEAPTEQPHPALLARQRMEEAWKRIEAHEKASQELSTYYQDEVQRTRTVSSPQLPLPRAAPEAPCAVQYPPDGAGAPDVYVGRLDDKALASLSARTRELLAQLGLGAGLPIPYALERLQASAQKLGASVAQDPKAARSVVQVGGAFWMAEPHPHVPAPAAATKAAPAPPGRFDMEYHGFYPVPYDDSFATTPPLDCRVKPLGIADYRRVEQVLHCYEPGEVAHIENILKGESKERVTRHLRRTEETFLSSSEEERIQEKDTQTTDRFELQKESERAVQEDIRFDMGVNVQAQYGVVRITADARFGYAHSSKESDRAASQYARGVTDRALERVVRKVREEQIRKVIDEFEETNTHKVEAKDTHTVGLYRWVNKTYQAKLVNYGKRLMVEFMVPEPGAFHLFAMTQEPVEGTVHVEKPLDPRSNEARLAYGVPSPLKDASYVTPSNYALWGALYGARLEPPPAAELTIAKAYHREGMDHTVQFADSRNDLRIPEGYEAVDFASTYGLHGETHGGGANWLSLVVGRHGRFSTSGGSFNHALNGEDDFVPVVLMGRTRFYAVNIEVRCARTDKTLRQWQLKTYDAILGAYQERLAAYEVAFAEAKARAGVEIRGTNPLRNREVEMTELRKGAIRLMTRCAPTASNAMKDAHPADPCSVPEFDCCEALRDGSRVQFIEQAFEWKLMTYLFYPYFWGRKCNWKKIYQLDDVDPLFLNFLQAGYARVQVPVRLGYEDAVLRFLADGTLWNGGSAPGIDSELYLAIANELKEPVGQVDPEVEPWLVTVPTTLTVLQCESGCVEGSGLPCPGEVK